MSAEPFLKVWEHHVFQMLIEKGRIKPKLARRMQNWKYTGFSVHKDVKIEAGDEDGLKRLTHYIARCPVAEAKIHQESPEDDVLYDAQHPNPLPYQKWRALPQERIITRNFEVFDLLDFLAQVTQHIPDKNGHLIRYYGWSRESIDISYFARECINDCGGTETVLRGAKKSCALKGFMALQMVFKLLT